MSKQLDYLLEYREKGQKELIEIKIDFVSRGIARDFERLNAKQEALRLKWRELVDNEYLAQEYKNEKPEGWKLKVKDLDARKEELNHEILAFDKNGFIDEQHALIQLILQDNCVKNPMLLDADFWERKVDVQDMMSFIIAVIYKDIDLKKKQ